MDKTNRYKLKSKKTKSDKPKQSKKKKCEGSKCSTFLSELTRKFMPKKKQQETSNNIVQSIIDSITNTLPIKFSMKSPKKTELPLRIEPSKTDTPKLIPDNTTEVSQPNSSAVISPLNLEVNNDTNFQIPEIPVTYDKVSQPIEKAERIREDVAIHTNKDNTNIDNDMAGEIAKHVATLRKISLIAEEFNKKTAKNLKEIVDSVQQDLVKKLEEVKAEQQAGSIKSEKNYKSNTVKD